MRRRTEITIETERVLLFSRTRYAAPAPACEVCGAGARVMALDEAAARLRVSIQTMTRIAEAAGLHLRPAADGTTLICLLSHTVPRASARAAAG